jgi:hypothetical protein
MPLPLPHLDDRSWLDLVDEGLAQIPRYAPEWTDHNVHDPGRTILELYAWLTEMAIYRLDRIPDRHKRKFLSLIGFTAQPPHPARTFLSFKPVPGSGPFVLPKGIEFETGAEGTLPTQFRTLRDFTISVVSLSAIQIDEGLGVLRDRTVDLYDGLPIALLGNDPHPDAALYLGFRDLPSETPVALAFRLQGPGNDREARDRIVREAAAQASGCRPIRPEIQCEGAKSTPLPPEPVLPPYHSARLVWEAFTANPIGWLPLHTGVGITPPTPGNVVDDTRSLTLDGIVEFNAPATIDQTTEGSVSEPLFYLRARLVSGGYDAPPTVLDIMTNGVEAEQSVQMTQTFTIAAAAAPMGTPPSPGASAHLEIEIDDQGYVQALTFLPPGALDAPEVRVLNFTPPAGGKDGALTLEMLLAGRGAGTPDQHLMLLGAPIDIETVRLYTHAAGTWQKWTQRNDFDASIRTDYHFVLDAMTGEIKFGDGEHGRAPTAAALIFAVYRQTRADSGNVRAGAITQLVDSATNSTLLAGLSSYDRDQLSRIAANRAPAAGGSSEETLDHVIGRAVETVHAHERLLELCAERHVLTLDQVDPRAARALQAPTRAVNLLDIERVTLDVPGARIARARAWAAAHPAYPCIEAPGVVTVVVMPDMPVAKPEPTKGLLEAVGRYLDRRRMVCTRIEVAGPRYLAVAVASEIRMRAGANAVNVREKVIAALDAFLDPRRGGPCGLGWPFGRDIYRSEILQLLDNVPGVDHVLTLTLRGDMGTARCGDLPLCATWLPTPAPHDIEVVST